MVDYKNPNLLLEKKGLTMGKVSWRSPSNIALVKYWGKYGRQLPSNPSVSLTLKEAHTDTTITYSPERSNKEGIELEFLFEGQYQPAFANRIKAFLESILDIFPFLAQLKIKIESQNSFPHSTGIASSASAMSALALCLCSLEEELFGNKLPEAAFMQKASYIARLGSGSASRSVFPCAAVWGSHPAVPQSSNTYAVGIETSVHPIFHTYHDDILIVSRKKKEVSSTAGHKLMEDHPFANTRFQQARHNLGTMLQALSNGDLESFGTILEMEALTLHGLMMSSLPPFILLEPNTLSLIRMIKAYRAEQHLPLHFTLDAGPNLHLLYPDSIAPQVNEFISSELKALCEDRVVIQDVVGQGAVKI